MSSPGLKRAISELLWPNIGEAWRPQLRRPHLRWERWAHEPPKPGTLPYGWWTEANGCEVIFSRSYCPMFRVHLDGRVTRPDPTAFVDFIMTCWFFDDASSPYRRGKENRFRKKVLEAMAADLEIRCQRDVYRGTIWSTAQLPEVSA
jgi:hypothetical protein